MQTTAIEEGWLFLPVQWPVAVVSYLLVGASTYAVALFLARWAVERVPELDDSKEREALFAKAEVVRWYEDLYGRPMRLRRVGAENLELPGDVLEGTFADWKNSPKERAIRRLYLRKENLRITRKAVPFLIPMLLVLLAFQSFAPVVYGYSSAFVSGFDFSSRAHVADWLTERGAPTTEAEALVITGRMREAEAYEMAPEALRAWMREPADFVPVPCGRIVWDGAERGWEYMAGSSSWGCRG